MTHQIQPSQQSTVRGRDFGNSHGRSRSRCRNRPSLGLTSQSLPRLQAARVGTYTSHFLSSSLAGLVLQFRMQLEDSSRGRSRSRTRQIPSLGLTPHTLPDLQAARKGTYPSHCFSPSPAGHVLRLGRKSENSSRGRSRSRHQPSPSSLPKAVSPPHPSTQVPGRARTHGPGAQCLPQSPAPLPRGICIRSFCYLLNKQATARLAQWFSLRTS